MRIYKIAKIGDGPIEYSDEDNAQHAQPNMASIPAQLYHVAKSHVYEKIKEQGLRADVEVWNKTYPEWSKEVVYLCSKEAVSNLLIMHGPNGSLVYEIDTNLIDKNLLWNDQNVTTTKFFEYHGNIPPNAIKLIPYEGTFQPKSP